MKGFSVPLLKLPLPHKSYGPSAFCLKSQSRQSKEMIRQQTQLVTHSWEVLRAVSKQGSQNKRALFLLYYAIIFTCYHGLAIYLRAVGIELVGTKQKLYSCVLVITYPPSTKWQRLSSQKKDNNSRQQ